MDVGIWNDQNTFIFIINDDKDVKLIFEHPVIKGSKFLYNNNIFSIVKPKHLSIKFLVFKVDVIYQSKNSILSVLIIIFF